MTKTLRSSVSFPVPLHTAVKVAVATAYPRITLTAFVARAVEASHSVSNRALEAAHGALIRDQTARSVRSTITFPCGVAYLANNRADSLGMSTSQFIAAVVAHKLSQNGK